MLTSIDAEKPSYIGRQVGDHLALMKSSKRGYVIAFRPYERKEDTVVKHVGTVGLMLATKLPYGTWVLEIDGPTSMLYYLVRWSHDRNEWENLGKVRFGSL